MSPSFVFLHSKWRTNKRHKYQSDNREKQTCLLMYAPLCSIAVWGPLTHPTAVSNLPLLHSLHFLENKKLTYFQSAPMLAITTHTQRYFSAIMGMLRRDSWVWCVRFTPNAFYIRYSSYYRLQTKMSKLPITVQMT